MAYFAGCENAGCCGGCVRDSVAPYRVLVVYNSFAIHRYMELWFLMFCKTMIFINSAINPILYNVMSIKFRRAFKIMLSCGKTKKKIQRTLHQRRRIPCETSTSNRNIPNNIVHSRTDADFVMLLP
ncbi:thyrotropin-releasing hormone receptor [Caerostris extrusa]|uniref:Thyrotropin-releasing hormone receptor n=1 Tax=Caerostris extrusa TaxID=172846 RepID=A0AAV4XSN2_CAEEX|nr:thyrotropin-releasing hormone receptor [Caerostris extrusa]